MRTDSEVYVYFIAIILTNYCLLTTGQSSEAECAWTACGANSCDDEAYPYKWATGTCKVNSLCLTDSSPRLYCCNEPSPYSETYWIGTSPVCGASCDFCKAEDECIISKDTCGDGSACRSGSKTLCGKLNPAEHLKKIPWFYWLIGAAALVAVGLFVLGTSIACCNYCKCCTS